MKIPMSSQDWEGLKAGFELDTIVGLGDQVGPGNHQINTEISLFS